MTNLTGKAVLNYDGTRRVNADGKFVVASTNCCGIELGPQEITFPYGEHVWTRFNGILRQFGKSGQIGNPKEIAISVPQINAVDKYKIIRPYINSTARQEVDGGAAVTSYDFPTAHNYYSTPNMTSEGYVWGMLQTNTLKDYYFQKVTGNIAERLKLPYSQTAPLDNNSPDVSVANTGTASGRGIITPYSTMAVVATTESDHTDYIFRIRFSDASEEIFEMSSTSNLSTELITATAVAYNYWTLVTFKTGTIVTLAKLYYKSNLVYENNVAVTVGGTVVNMPGVIWITVNGTKYLLFNNGELLTMPTLPTHCNKTVLYNDTTKTLIYFSDEYTHHIINTPGVFNNTGTPTSANWTYGEMSTSTTGAYPLLMVFGDPGAYKLFGASPLTGFGEVIDLPFNNPQNMLTSSNAKSVTSVKQTSTLNSQQYLIDTQQPSSIKTPTAVNLTEMLSYETENGFKRLIEHGTSNVAGYNMFTGKFEFTSGGFPNASSVFIPYFDGENLYVKTETQNIPYHVKDDAIKDNNLVSAREMSVLKINGGGFVVFYQNNVITTFPSGDNQLLLPPDGTREFVILTNNNTGLLITQSGENQPQQTQLGSNVNQTRFGEYVWIHSDTVDVLMLNEFIVKTGVFAVQFPTQTTKTECIVTENAETTYYRRDLPTERPDAEFIGGYVKSGNDIFYGNDLVYTLQQDDVIVTASMVSVVIANNEANTFLRQTDVIQAAKIDGIEANSLWSVDTNTKKLYYCNEEVVLAGASLVYSDGAAAGTLAEDAILDGWTIQGACVLLTTLFQVNEVFYEKVIVGAFDGKLVPVQYQNYPLSYIDDWRCWRTIHNANRSNQENINDPDMLENYVAAYGDATLYVRSEKNNNYYKNRTIIQLGDGTIFMPGYGNDELIRKLFIKNNEIYFYQSLNNTRYKITLAQETTYETIASIPANYYPAMAVPTTKTTGITGCISSNPEQNYNGNTNKFIARYEYTTPTVQRTKFYGLDSYNNVLETFEVSGSSTNYIANNTAIIYSLSKYNNATDTTYTSGNVWRNRVWIPGTGSASTSNFPTNWAFRTNIATRRVNNTAPREAIMFDERTNTVRIADVEAKIQELLENGYNTLVTLTTTDKSILLQMSKNIGSGTYNYTFVLWYCNSDTYEVTSKSSYAKPTITINGNYTVIDIPIINSAGEDTYTGTSIVDYRGQVLVSQTWADTAQKCTFKTPTIAPNIITVRTYNAETNAYEDCLYENGNPLTTQKGNTSNAGLMKYNGGYLTRDAAGRPILFNLNTQADAGTYHLLAQYAGYTLVEFTNATTVKKMFYLDQLVPYPPNRNDYGTIKVHADCLYCTFTVNQSRQVTNPITGQISIFTSEELEVHQYFKGVLINSYVPGTDITEKINSSYTSLTTSPCSGYVYEQLTFPVIGEWEILEDETAFYRRTANYEQPQHIAYSQPEQYIKSNYVAVTEDDGTLGTIKDPYESREVTIYNYYAKNGNLTLATINYTFPLFEKYYYNIYGNVWAYCRRCTVAGEFHSLKQDFHTVYRYNVGDQYQSIINGEFYYKDTLIKSFQFRETYHSGDENAAAHYNIPVVGSMWLNDYYTEPFWTLVWEDIDEYNIIKSKTYNGETLFYDGSVGQIGNVLYAYEDISGMYCTVKILSSGKVYTCKKTSVTSSPLFTAYSAVGIARITFFVAAGSNEEYFNDETGATILTTLDGKFCEPNTTGGGIHISQVTFPLNETPNLIINNEAYEWEVEQNHAQYWRKNTNSTFCVKHSSLPYMVLGDKNGLGTPFNWQTGEPLTENEMNQWTCETL